jgi:radical SAM superfamily enzyme YgiQ (UPF0313 family)
LQIIATDKASYQGHGIIVGGMVERQDTSDSRIQHSSNIQTTHSKALSTEWVSIKRAPGAHRIASELRDCGWDIEVIDFWQAWPLEDFQQFIKLRVSRKTKFLGISTLFAMTSSRLKIQQNEKLAWFKKTYPWIPIIAGSMNLMASAAYNPVDYFCTGFGEKGIVQLLQHLQGKPNSVVIKEYNYKKRIYKVVECNTHHPAFPEKNLITRYEVRDFIQPDEILTVELARGCKFKCKFCSFSVLGVKGDYTRCLDGFKEEVTENYERWGVKAYTVGDETINDRTEKLIGYGDVVQSLDFELELFGFLRGDLIAARPEDWEHIAKMGLWSHFYGIESFTHSAAKSIGKGMAPDRIKQSLFDVKDYFNKTLGKYRATYSQIIGLPTETPESFLEQFKWLITNFPNQSYNYYPLMMSRAADTAFMSNPSEFERTWEHSGIFTEINHTEAKQKWQDLKIDDEVRRQLNAVFNTTSIVKWKTDSMNIFQAAEVFNECHSMVDHTKVAPHIFYYHRYTTANDLTPADMVKSFKDVAPFGESHYNNHINFIKQYIDKKLAF